MSETRNANLACPIVTDYTFYKVGKFPDIVYTIGIDSTITLDLADYYDFNLNGPDTCVDYFPYYYIAFGEDIANTYDPTWLHYREPAEYSSIYVIDTSDVNNAGVHPATI